VVGVIVISHGDMAKGILSSVDMLCPDHEQNAFLSVQPDTNPDVFQEELRKKVAEVDTGDGVLIMADLFGGTPCNQALYLMSEKVHILSGMNLPMLLTVFLSRRGTNDITELESEAVDAAKEGILNVNEYIKNQ